MSNFLIYGSYRYTGSWSWNWQSGRAEAHPAERNEKS
jgi:hypothetical protein